MKHVHNLCVPAGLSIFWRNLQPLAARGIATSLAPHISFWPGTFPSSLLLLRQLLCLAMGARQAIKMLTPGGQRMAWNLLLAC